MLVFPLALFESSDILKGSKTSNSLICLFKLFESSDDLKGSKTKRNGRIDWLFESSDNLKGYKTALYNSKNEELFENSV